MKRKLNKVAIVLSFALAFSGLYGCGKEAENASAEQTVEETYESDLDSIELTDIEDLEVGRTSMSDPGNTSGAEEGGYGPYLDKINELKSEGLADQFTLAFINDDGRDTPELIASDSTGSFNHENAFIFTIEDGEVVEVASVIAGVDGANLDYAIGANLVHISGATAGMRDAFYRIEKGRLEEVFVAEASSMDEDAKYSINKESVKEDDYYKQINDFMEPYNPLVRIASDGLYDVTYTYSDGFGGFEQGSCESYTPDSEITGNMTDLYDYFEANIDHVATDFKELQYDDSYKNSDITTDISGPTDTMETMADGLALAGPFFTVDKEGTVIGISYGGGMYSVCGITTGMPMSEAAEIAKSHGFTFSRVEIAHGTAKYIAVYDNAGMELYISSDADGDFGKTEESDVTGNVESILLQRCDS